MGTVGCAANQADSGDLANDVYDPLEPVNRVVFQFNDVVDQAVIRPVAWGYTKAVPDPIRANVTNFLRNLRTPVVLLNELLQGDWEGAEIAATRFFVNTTLGLGGIVDVVGYNRPEYAFQSEDFGQTLAVWGVGEGPYLVLPLLGPSNPRDATGFLVDTVTDPLFIYGQVDDLGAFPYVRLGLTVVDERSRVLDALDEVRRSSVDYYAALRSLYSQRRQAQIRDGEPPDVFDIPDYDDTAELPAGEERRSVGMLYLDLDPEVD